MKVNPLSLAVYRELFPFGAFADARLAAAQPSMQWGDGDEPPEDDRIEFLQTQLEDLQSRASELQANADRESRDLSEDENEQIEKVFAEFASVEAQIQRRKQLNAMQTRMTAAQPRRVQAAAIPEHAGADTPHITGGEPNGATRGSGGFRHMGEFAVSVHRAGLGGPQGMDPRLVRGQPTTTSNIGTPAEGGYAVPPDFREEILDKVAGDEDSLLSMTDQLTSSSNSLTVPKNESTPWGANGAQMNWIGEGAAITQSNVDLATQAIPLYKAAALMPVTEELLEDAPALSRFLSNNVPNVFKHGINTAIVRGTGTGQPTGLITSASEIVVAAEVGQAADTVLYQNIVNMWTRLFGPWRTGAVWLINQDVEPELMNMVFEHVIQNVAQTENVGGSGTPVYLPQGTIASAPFASLMNRPVIPIQACSTVGDVGDIILTNLSQYVTVLKTVGMRSDVSMHLFFNYDVTSFRFIMRIGGQSWMNGVITPQFGTNTLSNIVTLAARA